MQQRTVLAGPQPVDSMHSIAGRAIISLLAESSPALHPSASRMKMEACCGSCLPRALVAASGMHGSIKAVVRDLSLQVACCHRC